MTLSLSLSLLCGSCETLVGQFVEPSSRCTLFRSTCDPQRLLETDDACALVLELAQHALGPLRVDPARPLAHDEDVPGRRAHTLVPRRRRGRSRARPGERERVEDAVPHAEVGREADDDERVDVGVCGRGVHVAEVRWGV